MSDNTDAVLRISHSDAAYGIIARKRVYAISGGRLPTEEYYHAALVQCLKDKADEIERLRLTDAEREAVEAAVDSFASGADFNDQRIYPAMARRLRERAATLRGLLERLA